MKKETEMVTALNDRFRNGQSQWAGVTGYRATATTAHFDHTSKGHQIHLKSQDGRFAEARE